MAVAFAPVCLACSEECVFRDGDGAGARGEEVGQACNVALPLPLGRLGVLLPRIPVLLRNGEGTGVRGEEVGRACKFPLPLPLGRLGVLPRPLPIALPLGRLGVLLPRVVLALPLPIAGVSEESVLFPLARPRPLPLLLTGCNVSLIASSGVMSGYVDGGRSSEAVVVGGFQRALSPRRVWCSAASCLVGAGGTLAIECCMFRGSDAALTIGRLILWLSFILRFMMEVCMVEMYAYVLGAFLGIALQTLVRLLKLR